MDASSSEQVEQRDLARDGRSAQKEQRGEPGDGPLTGQTDRGFTRAEIARRFTYHPPVGDQQGRYMAIRDTGRSFAELILGNSPPSREQSLAITRIEEAVMWANAAIARREGE